MEQSEHMLEADVTNFGGNLSRGDDNSCQSTSLNEASFTNETKIVDASEGKREFIGDDIFLEKKRQMPINSDEVKNCLTIIAETYSSSDDETSPENSAEPVNSESSLVEDGSCQEMGINIVNKGVNPISVPENVACLEEQNNNFNSINLADASSQRTMFIKTEHLNEPESDEHTLMKIKNEGHTLMESDSVEHTVMNIEQAPKKPSEDGCIVIKPENNGCTLTESHSNRHMIIEPESGHTLTERGSDQINPIESESDRDTLMETESDGHTLVKTGSDENTLIKSESDGHMLIKPASDQSSHIVSESDRDTLMETESDGHMLVKTGSDENTLIKSESDGHLLIKPASDQSSHIASESDRDTLMETESDGHTLVKTGSDENTLIKSESDGHMLIKPASDQSSHIVSKSDRDTLMETDSDGHTLIKTDSDMNVLIKSESDGHIPIQLVSDGSRYVESMCDRHPAVKTNSDEHMLIKNDGHTLVKTETNEHILTGPENNEQEDNRLTLIQPKIEECSPTGPERHQDMPTCPDTEHPVYTMSSIDKELENIGEVQDISQTERPTESSTDDNSSSSDSSSDDDSSSSESESSDSSSVDDLTDIRNKLEKEEEHVQTGPLKTKSELSLKDLPVIPDFDITIDENVQLVELGVVFSIVESLVVVKALPQTPALDTESVLFLENRSCLGVVFETFGPVQNPFYSVRFNKDTDISDKNVHKGDKVFYAPNMMEYSNFVFVAQLKKLRGSDASWEHDEEPPQEAIEYSDDEEEAKARAGKKRERMARKGGGANNNEATNTEQSRASDHQRSNRGGRKRTWQSRGRGQLANQNQNQGTPCTNPSSLQHPAFRGPAPQPGGALSPQGPVHMVSRHVFPPQGPFISHPTPDAPSLDMRHMGPPRGIPPRAPLGMIPQPMGPFPGPNPGPMGNVPMPSFVPSRPLIGVQNMQGHWPMCPPSGLAPRYSIPGTQGFQNPGYQSRDVHFGMPPPPPPPPPR